MKQIARDPQTIIAGNCWNVIGVRGDKSCDALAEHAHCRNCPTYSEIAATLLDRPAIGEPAGHQAMCAVDSEQVASLDEHAILVFRLGEEWLGISMHALDEVVELRATHSLPHRPNPALLGIANVRGELVICVSLHGLLGIEVDSATEGRARRLLILRSESGRLAVPVDEVQHIFSYQQGDLIPPPSTVALASSTYTSGLVRWRNRTVAHIDATRVIEAFERCLG